MTFSCKVEPTILFQWYFEIVSQKPHSLQLRQPYSGGIPHFFYSPKWHPHDAYKSGARFQEKSQPALYTYPMSARLQ
jgi:hypothetical protein